MIQFRSSIHLQFDLPDPYLLDRYVLTSSHSQVLAGILRGVTEQGDKHAHLLIGPYGTGKSLLSTILCQLLSRQFAAEWSASLLEQANRIDTQLAAMLRAAREGPYTYIPVVINGMTGNLSKIMNQAVHRALHQAGIRIITTSESAAILHSVDRWKQSYPDAYRSFLCLLEERSIEEAEWRRQIEACNEELTQQFIAFYPSVTAGSAWSYDHEAHVIDNLESLSAKLAERQLGMFIVYDEFGRFLQTLDNADLSTNMQDLQTLAEFADRTENVQLLLISHKHIRQYAVGSRESIRLEFEKIEGRFRHYSLENDAETYLQLAIEALRNIDGLRSVRAADMQIAEALRRFPLFGEYTSYQLEQGMLTALYPIHPVTAILLPYLSNIYGQNERTLFSFLSDYERDSLREHVQQHSGYYYADRLFRFFRLEAADVREQSALELYHAVVPYVDSGHPLQKRIIELLTMWSETRLTQKQPITISFLAFALGVEETTAEIELSSLADAKIVRYNTVRDQWELFNGSSIDTEALIADKMSSSSLKGRESMDIMERHLQMSFIMPYEYNDDMDMLRYADIRFADIAEMTASEDKDWPGDDRIWLIAYEDQDRMDDPDAVMREMNKNYLAAFPPFSMEAVQPSLLKYKITDQLLHDTALLALDSRLKNELLFIREETSLAIRSFVDKYFEFDKLAWRSGTERVTVNDVHSLEGLISSRLMDKYPHTPIIRNEAFNRNRISAIQRRALTDVIDRLIQQPAEPMLGITGYGPNYLIFATVLKNNGYRFSDDGVVRCNETLEAIRQRLIRQLNLQPVGKLSELARILQEAPYGIRSSVVPLLFVALLRDRWEQLIFYAHDMMISHINGATVLEMIELAESFEYRYYNWSAVERVQLVEAGRRMGLPEEACQTFMHASEALLQWLRQLPKFTQISQQLSPQTRRIRDQIRSAEVDPYLYMKQLVADVDMLAAAKEEMESFLRHNELELERRVLALTEQPSFERLLEVINRIRHKAIGSSKFATLPIPENMTGLIDRMAEHLIGVARWDWSDATQELFVNQVQYEWRLFIAGSESPASQDMTIDIHRPLSKKSQLLYSNVKNMLKYAGKDVSPQEIRQLLTRLIQEM